MFFGKKHKISYQTDQNGIINRYLRESKHWHAHLDNTKSAILQAAAPKAKGSAAVLGSGWWLDVPVRELSEMFDNLTLIDIVHPREMQHKAKRMPNVELLTVDLNCGLADNVEQVVAEYRKTKKQPSLSEIYPNPNEAVVQQLQQFDYVVSVNLLNQLDILVVDFLRNQQLGTSDELINLRRNIQEFHTQILPRSKSLLVTDTVEMTAATLTDFEQQHYTERSLIHTSLSQYIITNSWHWYFDTHKTYYPDKVTIMKVESMAV